MMSPVMEGKERSRKPSPDEYDSPTRDRHSTRGRNSRRRDMSPAPAPAHRRSSPSTRSPHRTGFSRRARSPAKEKLPERARSPKPVRPRSPRGASRSPSPRTKRLRRVQAEQEADKLVERVKDDRKERHDEGSHRNHREDRDVSNGRKTARERDHGGSSRSMRVHEISPEVHGHKSRYRSRSPSTSKSGGREEATRSRDAEASRNGERDSIAKMKAAEDALENKEKQHKPSFELSGKLAEETNRVKGVTLLFTEPPDARKPDMRWRLYVFKGGEVLNEPLYVHRLSCYLFGRERRVADIPTDHPSCSKQHAVLQYRLVENEQPDGLSLKQARPYLMDLGSTNGTFINDNRIESQRYYELFEKDTIRFGNSSREYVLLHEHSTG